MTDNDDNPLISKKADVQLSKSLSWLLRHAAPSLGLKLSPDGFVPVEDVLALEHPRFRNKDHGGSPKYTVEDVVRVVRDNNKQRFRLDYKVRSLRKESCAIEQPTINLDHTLTSHDSNEAEVGVHDNKVLCIRANQGHSLKGLRTDQLLTPLTYQELTDPNLTIIHGTTRSAWEDHIRHEGLSRMRRNHIHFATGLPPSNSAKGKKKRKCENKTSGGTTPISGMRSSSEIYIYVDGLRCAKDGVPFYRSDNGVILTAGVQEKGVLPLIYFEKVIYAFSGKVV